MSAIEIVADVRTLMALGGGRELCCRFIAARHEPEEIRRAERENFAVGQEAGEQRIVSEILAEAVRQRIAYDDANDVGYEDTDEEPED